MMVTDPNRASLFYAPTIDPYASDNNDDSESSRDGDGDGDGNGKSNTLRMGLSHHRSSTLTRHLVATREIQSVLKTTRGYLEHEDRHVVSNLMKQIGDAELRQLSLFCQIQTMFDVNTGKRMLSSEEIAKVKIIHTYLSLSLSIYIYIYVYLICVGVCVCS